MISHYFTGWAAFTDYSAPFASRACSFHAVRSPSGVATPVLSFADICLARCPPQGDRSLQHVQQPAKELAIEPL
jgi:hypothetical protein